MMRTCQKCGAPMDDGAIFCSNCGYQNASAETAGMGGSYSPSYGQPSYQTPPYAQPAYDIYDKTASFDPKDISENKLYAVLPYLFSFLGVIAAGILAPKSEYVRFHIKQALKLYIMQAFALMLTVLLCWTLLVPFAGMIFALAVIISCIVAAVQVCSGKAVIPVLTRKFSSLDV